MDKHELKTIAEILSVITPQNVDCFIKDFEGFLKSYLMINSLCSAITENKNWGKFDTHKFVWIDDGKNDLTITIKMDNNPEQTIDLTNKKKSSKLNSSTEE